MIIFSRSKENNKIEFQEMPKLRTTNLKKTGKTVIISQTHRVKIRSGFTTIDEVQDNFKRSDYHSYRSKNKILKESSSLQLAKPHREFQNCLADQNLHQVSNDTLKRDVIGEFESKVEMFDPKDFENDSNFSDDSVSRSLSKKKKKQNDHYRISSDRQVSNEPDLPKRNLKDTLFGVTAKPDNVRVSKVKPFQTSEFVKQDVDNIESSQFGIPNPQMIRLNDEPDLPFKRKYHRLYQKKEMDNKENCINRDNRFKRQSMKQTHGNGKPQIKNPLSNQKTFIQENLGTASTNIYRPHTRNGGFEKGYSCGPNDHSNEIQGNVANAAKSFRKFRSKLYKVSQNQSDNNSKSAVENDCFSNSNSESKASYIFDAHSKDNSPNCHLQQPQQTCIN